MQDNAWLGFSERVNCEGYYHVDCVPLEQPMAAAQLHQLTERNLKTLSVTHALEDRHVENEDDSPVMQEIHRMDTKLTALIEMVNNLLVPGNSLPPRQLLRFNAVGAVLPATLLPPTGSLLLRLYLDVCRGLPLELPAQRESQLADGQLEDGHTFVAFTALSDVLSDEIERLVFRHHRRKVAEARQLP